MIFQPSQRDRAILYLDKLFEKSKFVKVEHIPETKSLNQLRYIWLVFTYIADETGTDKNHIYHIFLNRFPVLQELKNMLGEIELVPVSMSLFTKEQMTHFIDCVVTDGRSIGIDIPDPEDHKAIEMYDFYRRKGLL